MGTSARDFNTVAELLNLPAPTSTAEATADWERLEELKLSPTFGETGDVLIHLTDRLPPEEGHAFFQQQAIKLGLPAALKI